MTTFTKYSQFLKTVPIIGMFVLAILFVTSCTSASQQSNITQVFPLRIGFVTYPGHWPMYVAEEKGFFDDEGVDVEIVDFGSDFAAGIAGLGSNSVQIVGATADTPPILVSGGIDAKTIFATDIGWGADGLLVTDDIRSIAELKGRTVHLAVGSPSHFFFRYVAGDEGLRADDVTLSMMEPDQVGAAFAAGQIPYGVSWEPWLSKAAERRDGKVLFTSKDYPGVITDTFIARIDLLTERREDVKRLMRAWFKAVEYVQAHPEDAHMILAKKVGIPTADVAAQLSKVQFLDYQENIQKFEEANPKSFQELTLRAAEIYKQDGVINVSMAIDDVLDVTLLHALYEDQ